MSAQKLVKSENVVVSTEMTNLITKSKAGKALRQWIDLGCQLENCSESGGLKLVIGSGVPEAKAEDLFERIFNVLKKIEEECIGNPSVQLSMLIPVDKIGFLIGKQRVTIGRVEKKYGVKATVKNGRSSGLGYLILVASSVEGLGGAREEIHRLLKISDVQQAQPDSPTFMKFTKDQNGPREHYKLNLGQVNSNGIERTPSEASFGSSLSHFHEFIADTVELVIPAPKVKEVMGPGGTTIKQLQKQFGVRLAFLGNNASDYPKGRTIQILGYSPEKLEAAKKYICAEFVEKKLHPPICDWQKVLEENDWSEEEEADNNSKENDKNGGKQPKVDLTSAPTRRPLNFCQRAKTEQRKASFGAEESGEEEEDEVEAPRPIIQKGPTAKKCVLKPKVEQNGIIVKKLARKNGVGREGSSWKSSSDSSDTLRLAEGRGAESPIPTSSGNIAPGNSDEIIEQFKLLCELVPKVQKTVDSFVELQKLQLAEKERENDKLRQIINHFVGNQ